jgi:hypothetical protein
VDFCNGAINSDRNSSSDRKLAKLARGNKKSGKRFEN